MSMPVESRLHRQLSAICDASPGQRQAAASMPYLLGALPHLPAAQLPCWARCARFMTLAIVFLGVVVGCPPET